MASKKSKTFQRMALVDESLLGRLQEMDVTNFNPLAKGAVASRIAAERAIDVRNLRDDERFALMSANNSRLKRLDRMLNPDVSSREVAARSANQVLSEELPDLFEDARDVSGETRGDETLAGTSSMKGEVSRLDPSVTAAGGNQFDTILKTIEGKEEIVREGDDGEIVLYGKPLRGTNFLTTLFQVARKSEVFPRDGGKFLNALRDAGCDDSMFEHAGITAPLDDTFAESGSRSGKPSTTKSPSLFARAKSALLPAVKSPIHSSPTTSSRDTKLKAKPKQEGLGKRHRKRKSESRRPRILKLYDV